MAKMYELALILSGKLSEEEKEKTLAEIKKTLSSFGKTGNVLSLGKKNLAYPIKREKEGYYFVISFETEGKEVLPISRKLAINKAILRHLITLKD